jgi:hypothetical protein
VIPPPPPEVKKSPLPTLFPPERQKFAYVRVKVTGKSEDGQFWVVPLDSEGKECDWRVYPVPAAAIEEKR